MEVLIKKLNITMKLNIQMVQLVGIRMSILTILIRIVNIFVFRQIVMVIMMSIVVLIIIIIIMKKKFLLVHNMD